MRNWIDLLETMHPSPDDPGMKAIGYWFNPKTNAVFPVTWGWDEGDDSGNHHIDVAMDNPEQFFNTEQLKQIDELYADGGLCTDDVVSMATINGWCRISVAKWPGKKYASCSMDAPDFRTAQQSLKWVVSKFPETAELHLGIYQSGPNFTSYHLQDDAFERFLSKGMVGKPLNESVVEWQGKSSVWTDGTIHICVNDPEDATLVTAWGPNARGQYVEIGFISTRRLAGLPRNYLAVSSSHLSLKYRGQGIGMQMYRSLIAHLSTRYDGLASYLPDVRNKKQVPNIWKKLGGKPLEGNPDYLVVQRNNEPLTESVSDNGEDFQIVKFLHSWLIGDHMGESGQNAVKMWRRISELFPPNITEPVTLYRVMTCPIEFTNNKQQVNVSPYLGVVSSWTTNQRAINVISGTVEELKKTPDTARVAVVAKISPECILATHETISKAIMTITKTWKKQYPEIIDSEQLSTFPNWPEVDGREAEKNIQNFSMLHVNDLRRWVKARGGYANQWEVIVETPHSTTSEIIKIFRKGSKVIRQYPGL